jgi:hypothetical protein
MKKQKQMKKQQMKNNSKWIPEIYYEDYGKGEESLTGGIPFINVPSENNMPKIIFIYESRDLSEHDEEIEKEIILHSYANMLELKEKLDIETYDKVRNALGLEPLKKAEDLGRKINEKISVNLEINS